MPIATAPRAIRHMAIAVLPEIHDRLRERARREHKPLQQLVQDVLWQAAGEPTPAAQEAAGEQ